MSRLLTHPLRRPSCDFLESEVPKKDVKRAVENLEKYMSRPDVHTYEAEV